MVRLYLLIALFLSSMVQASAQATFITIEIDKRVQPGLVLLLPENMEVVEGTILQKMGDAGYSPETKGKLFWKKRKLDGFYVFNGVTIPAFKNQKLDMYFKVRPENNSRNQQSLLYLLVSKGYDNFISPDIDSVIFLAAAGYLNGFVGTTASYRQNLDVDEQVLVIKNEEKKLVNLKDEERSIVKKIDELQAELRNNKNDQVRQEGEIARQKQRLDELKVILVRE